MINEKQQPISVNVLDGAVSWQDKLESPLEILVSTAVLTES